MDDQPPGFRVNSGMMRHLNNPYWHFGIEIEQQTLGIENQMGLFSKLPTTEAKPVPQSFDSEVLRRRANEVRLQYSHASGRLFDMCYSIQKTGQLPDPEDLSHTLGAFLQARAMTEFLEEMQMDAQIIQVAAPGNSECHP
jgi:hypothetical protein